MEEQKKKPHAVNFEKKQKSSLSKTLLWIGSVVVLVLAAITFIFVPGMVRGLGGGGQAPIFGYYNKKPISQTAEPYFIRMLEQYSDYARQSGQSADQTYSIYQSAFTSTVIHLAYNRAVEESGYAVPTKKIDRAMLPYFLDANGVYSPKRFNDTPLASRIAMRKELTDSLIHSRYYDDLFGSSSETIDGYQLYGRKTASNEDKFIKKMGAVERSFELAAFPLSDYPITEAEKFGRENPDLFKKYNLSVITASTEDAAKKIKTQLDKNEIVFDDAVTELSLRYYSGDDGKLTSSYQYQIKNIVTSDESLDTIIALKTGDLSPVLQTVNGFSIFRIDGEPVSGVFVEPQIISNYMTIYERGRIEDYYTNIARDFSVAAARDGFDAACEAFGIGKVDVTPFPLNYGNSELLGTVPSSSLTELNGAETNTNFIETAFSLRQNEISTPFVLGNNVIVIKLNEETTKTDDTDDEIFSTFSLEQYYISQFDQMASQNLVMKDKRFKDDFTNVFFKYYFGN
jgi:hypothetical protein